MSEKSPDWDAALALFVQGKTYRAIAEQIGVTPDAARMHGSRHSWGRLRTMATVEKLPASEKPLKSLAEQSAKVRQLIAKDVEVSTELLPKMKHSASAAGFRQRAQAVAELTGVAKTVFAWGEADSRPAVRIDVMRIALEASRKVADTQPVIDVDAADVPALPAPPPDPAA